MSFQVFETILGNWVTAGKTFATQADDGKQYGDTNLVYSAEKGVLAAYVGIVDECRTNLGTSFTELADRITATANELGLTQQYYLATERDAESYSDSIY